MKGIVRYVVGAAVLGILGALCLGVSRLDRQVAEAQQMFLTSDYERADASLGAVERYYEYASGVPWIGEAPLNDIRARRGAISYWRGQFEALAPAERTDPVADVPPGNVALQLIVADAAYRAGVPRVTDRATTLALLESAIAGYRTVLNNARRPADAAHAAEAAYNYEHVVRLRDDIVKGRRRGLPEPDADGALGQRGKSEDAEFEQEFRQYIPLEQDERDPPAAGEFDPPSRKG
jgi:hypothetical protein